MRIRHICYLAYNSRENFTLLAVVVFVYQRSTCSNQYTELQGKPVVSVA